VQDLAGLQVSVTGTLSLAAGTDILIAAKSMAGQMSLRAGGDILDQHMAGAMDGDIDLQADTLSLTAGNAIGLSTDPIETSVTYFEASGGAGGVYVLEADGLTQGVVQAKANGAVDIRLLAGEITFSGDSTGVGDVTISDVLRVDGASTITAGTGGAGNLVLSSAVIGVDGDSDETEVLTLQVNGGNVELRGAVSNIDGLTVSGARDVSFAETVSVTGQLTIDATGVVTFSKNLTLSGAAQLTIRGATALVFAAGVQVQVAGDVTLNAESLSLLGGADSLSGTGVLSLGSATSSGNLRIDTASGSVAADGALNLGETQIKAIGAGFARVVLGTAGLGAVSVAGDADLSSLGAVPLEIQGKAITVTAAGAGTVLVAADLSLRAEDGLRLESGITTAIRSAISLVSSQGQITMAAGTRLASQGGNVTVSAVNASTLTVAGIDARAAGATRGGVVDIQAGAATVTAANSSAGVDIFATAVNFAGYGPGAGAMSSVLQVQADVVQVSAPEGLVVRDTAADGRTSFNLMKGGQLFHQLQATSGVTRVTQDPATLLTKSDDALVAAGLPTNSQLLARPSVPTPSLNWAFDKKDPASASNMMVASYLRAVSASESLASPAAGIEIGFLQASDENDLLSAQSYGLAERLERAYVLGTPGAQPLISGLDSFSEDTFDYWVDTLTV
jgi:hypothetical protein